MENCEIFLETAKWLRHRTKTYSQSASALTIVMSQTDEFLHIPMGVIHTM